MSFTQVRPCDREIDLYIMANLGENPTFGNVHQCNVACNHTFIVQPVYDSNMLMVAIPHACQHCERERLRLEPHEALLPESNVTTACVKTPLHRQRPDTCYNYHAAVSESINSTLYAQCRSRILYCASDLTMPIMRFNAMLSQEHTNTVS